MRDDVRTVILGLIALFVVVVSGWVIFVFGVGCGLSLDCEKGARLPERTPIPTLIPASLPLAAPGEQETKVSCQVTAVDLIGAWVNAGYPESDSFTFTDINEKDCTATFAGDVQKLFLEGNLWYSGAPACTTCHSAELNEATASMDLSTYEGMLAGSRRASSDETGNDILGNGVWEDSMLYTQLYVKQVMPFGRPPEVPAEGPVIFAGSEVEATN